MNTPLIEEALSAALAEATAGVAQGGMPFGAALIVGGSVRSVGRNRQLQDARITAHAEVECFEAYYRAERALPTGSILVATEAPCPMCAGAALVLGVGAVVIGEQHHYAGALSLLREHDIPVTDLNDDRCLALVSEFRARHPDRWRAFSAG